MRHNRPSPPTSLADVFNTRHPVGTQVRYWAGPHEGPGTLSRTASAARLLPSGIAVVQVEGRDVPVPLVHLEPVGIAVGA